MILYTVHKHGILVGMYKDYGKLVRDYNDNMYWEAPEDEFGGLAYRFYDDSPYTMAMVTSDLDV